MTKLITLFSILLFSLNLMAETSWQDVTQKANGQTVYFHAWGGSQEINNYLRWANKRLQKEYGVTLKRMKCLISLKRLSFDSRKSSQKTPKEASIWSGSMAKTSNP